MELFIRNIIENSKKINILRIELLFCVYAIYKLNKKIDSQNLEINNLKKEVNTIEEKVVPYFVSEESKGE